MSHQNLVVGFGLGKRKIATGGYNMDQRVMISLIGEQPIPNLLPIRYEKPDRVILVYTDYTKNGFERLKNHLGDDLVEPLKVDSPYDIFAIQEDLKMLINSKGFSSFNTIFNLTGGTKPMAFASYLLAEELSSPFLYLQSEGSKSLIYHYEFSKGKAQLIKRDVIPDVLTIDDYLKAHLGSYGRASVKEPFEELVSTALCDSVSEIANSVTKGTLEIDLVIRCGNQVGIAEIKSGKKALKKEGIDQLNTAGEQRYLGTYTRKFFIVDRKIGSQNRALAEAHHIRVVELCSAESGSLSPEDRENLVQIIRTDLGAH